MGQLSTTNLSVLSSRFNEISREHSAVNFEAEKAYTMSILKNNNFLMGIAESNPSSLEAAVLNVAGAGISLNPVLKHAYLVPRKVDKRMAVCLDVSYMGLIHLAVKSGSVMWCHSEVVRMEDSFEMLEIDQMPKHRWSPFKERGPVVGVYCVAKLHDGSYMTRVMDMEKIKKVMESSEAYKAFKAKKTYQCPWVDHFDEMAKKTVVKQASKYWPKSDLRFKNAIEILNQHEGINFENKEERIEYSPIDYKKREEQLIKVRDLFGKLCCDMKNSEKVSFLNEVTGFTSFADVELQDNETLDKYISYLVMKKTAIEVDDKNNLPYEKTVEISKEEKAIATEVLEKEEPEKEEKKSVKDVTFKIED